MMHYMRTSAVSDSSKKKIASGLQQVLADSYALMAATQHAHWNVEGDHFYSLHKAFEEQYKELFEAIDEIAEHIRTLGAYAVGGLHRLHKESAMEELKTDLEQKEYVAALVVMHEKLVHDAIKVRDLAGDSGDSETEDLMIQRVASHEKTLWMLKSYLK
jgi:starvation-inducible DNA-binding protein